MKTYYKNTPIKNRKKERRTILTCAAILTVGCVLSGCSMSKEDTGNGIAEIEDIKEEAEDISGRSEPEDAQMEQEPVDDISAGNDAPEETMMLTFMRSRILLRYLPGQMVIKIMAEAVQANIWETRTVSR